MLGKRAKATPFKKLFGEVLLRARPQIDNAGVWRYDCNSLQIDLFKLQTHTHVIRKYAAPSQRLMTKVNFISSSELVFIRRPAVTYKRNSQV
jgi:hypothetical protein